MALAAIQASYDDDKIETSTIVSNEEIEDQMAVIIDPAFSIMSKIKLNLAPAIAIQVGTDTSLPRRDGHLQEVYIYFFSRQIQVVF
jgi:hypothetical protein